MPAPSTNSQLDGLSTVREGMHSGISPRMLPKDQVAFAINMTFRNGLPRTRPNWVKLALSFHDTATAANATQGLWQNGSFYQAIGQGENCLVASIGGRLFRYLIGDRSASVQDISINATTNVAAPGFTVPAVGASVVVPLVSKKGLYQGGKIIIDSANYTIVTLVDTVTTAPFTVPAVSSPVTINLAVTQGLIAGVVFTIGGGDYQVTSITAGNVIATNLTGTPATVIATGTSASSIDIVAQNIDGVPGVAVATGAPVTYSDLNDSQNPNCWMWQSEDFLIVQNGAANPLFFDGGGTRRSLGQSGNELPPGCMGCYAQGRNWMALPDVNQGPSNSYIAGDLVFSHGFNDNYDGREAVLQTTELSLATGGGPLSVPVSAGPITGFGTVAVPDTSLGHGALQVHTLTSVFSVNAGFDRTTWFTQNNIQIVVALPNYGTVSQDALTTVNGDSWYRSLDGLRSYQIGRRDQGTWVSTPLSVEVEKILARDTPQWMDKCSGVLFNNRLLTTNTPFQVYGRGIGWRGITALDFNNISNLTTRSQPCYDGLWTGVAVLKIVKGTFARKERCFAWVMGCDGGIELWELLKDDAEYFDWDGTQNVAVQGALETRAMGWSDNGNRLKRLQTCDLYLDKLAGDDNVLLGLKYRSDEDPLWRAWPVCAGASQATLCAPIQDCAATLCNGFEDIHEQYATYLRWNDPPDTPCSAITARSPRTGYEFQVRLSFSGFIQINRLHAWAEPMSDSVRNVGVTNTTCNIVKGCEEPWFRYTANGCGNIPPLPPGPTPCIPQFIVEEGGEPIVVERGDVGLRTEDQTPCPPGTSPFPVVPPPPTPPVPPVTPPPWPGPFPPPPPVPPTPVGPPSPVVPPNVPPPVWPPPSQYPCHAPDTNFYWQLPVADTGTDPAVVHNVGIPNTGDDPALYFSGLGYDATAIIQTWANAIWLQFVNSGTPYTQARLVWSLQPDGGRDWFAQSVFPDGTINFGSSYNLDIKIAVEYC